LGQQVDRVTRVGWGNRDSNLKSGNSIRVNRVGNTEQKIGGSRRVVNTESQVVENLANTKSQVAENSAKKESRAMENSVNMENRVMQDLGGKKPKEGKCATPSKRPSPRWCPRGITKTQEHRLQMMHQGELAKKKEEEE
jgi:hypothetical protein